MIPLTLRELAGVVGGRATGDGEVTRVVIDSRRVRPGDLFVALPGERVDGHDYARAAVEAGAAGVLATRDVGVPAVLVEDATEALGRLACWTSARLPARVVGITGSSGKTSTKDLVAQVLERAGTTVAPPGSYNNELGLPLTVLSAGEDTDFLVLEMGARGTGHIAWLCGIAPPDVAVVLNVGTAHLGEFGSREAIAKAKGELVEALRPDGLAVLNAADPLVHAMRDRTTARVVEAWADCDAEGVTLDELGRASFTLVTPNGRAPVSLRLVGEHHAGNALAAAAVGEWAGLPTETVADALSEATPRSRWRMEVTETPDGVTVVNDAYNANPDSMRAALKTLAGAAARGRRTWAVLGEMAELGDASWDAHDEIGRLCVRLNVARLVVVGERAKGIHAGASLEGSWGDEAVFVETKGEALALLRAELRPGDVVLVKASRAVGLESVALALTGESSEGGAA
ncbi:MAG TPA: UDP-N-acetylmuramoyl-tripeptide--D-alanyl-D-alanine ligase [Mycobacteriales bacterium]|jgi:UDP-N-acetylmuramoyl-tripeptide--D-alanyl-D-alanine ligase